MLALFFACNNNTQEPPKAVTLTTATYKKSAGRDCAQMDSIHHQCAQLQLAWPEVKDGAAPLKTSVAAWANKFLVGVLEPEAKDSTAAGKTLEAAARSFFQTHGEWSKEAPESPLGEWVAESTDTVLLNDGAHLTLQINAYIFTGGAHGMPLSAVGTFDVATGKQLTWAEMVSDSEAFKVLAEKKFRETRADIFKSEGEGGSAFDFDETFSFQLPGNYGLTDKGIYCIYLPYEVTPYVFGNTEFVIPFGEMGALLKLKK